MLSPGKITREEFDEALGRYPALIKSISTSKTPVKNSQDSLTLEQLDKYRFEAAPLRYYIKEDLEDPKAEPAPLSHADVVQLVRWKLKHGTFRPNLLKLAESNPQPIIESTTLSAFTTYKTDSYAPTKAITTLTNLKGIGPATASLLLSVHDCARVPFFSDELYQWIVHDGKKTNIRYNIKEYEDLVTGTRKLLDRLSGFDARDIEKVAFVMMKEAGSDKSKPAAAEPNSNSTSTSTLAAPKAPAPAKEKKSHNRKAGPKPPKEPTDMTEERKAQLQEIAEKARAARVAKRAAREAAREAKGVKFRERVNAAREKRREGGEPSTPSSAKKAGAGVKRKSEVMTRRTASEAKRSRRSDA